MNHEIRRNEDGTIDEIVGFGYFHLEQMDDGLWSLIVDTLDGHRILINLHTKRNAKIHVLAEYDGKSDLAERILSASGEKKDTRRSADTNTTYT